MCWIDFGMPVDRDDESDMANGQDQALASLQGTPVNGSLKRKLKEYQNKLLGRKNFDIFTFRDPVLFIGHLSKSCVLIIDKPWREVIKTFNNQPVHRHVFGA